MRKMFFELLLSPLTISDNYYLNSIIIALIGLIAFKVAFKVVGDLGVKGGFGSLLHWTIRFIVFILLWSICCIGIIATKFIISHVILILILVIGLALILFLAKCIYNRVIYN